MSDYSQLVMCDKPVISLKVVLQKYCPHEKVLNCFNAECLDVKISVDDLTVAYIDYV